MKNIINSRYIDLVWVYFK